MNKYNFKSLTISSLRLDQQDEDGQMLDEIELYTNLKFNRNLTKTDIENNDNKSSLEQKIQWHKFEYSGWKFDNISSLIMYFFRIVAMNGSSWVKFPLRCSPILNIEIDDFFVSFGQS